MSELLDIENRFYPAAIIFAEAKARDVRDSSLNKDFLAKRNSALAHVNQILDDYLDLRTFYDLATPLEPNA